MRTAVGAQRSGAWTPEAIRALGVKTTIPIAGEILANLSRTQSYQRVRDGDFPVPVFRVGRRMFVATAHILHKLGIDDANPTANPGVSGVDAGERGERAGT